MNSNSAKPTEAYQLVNLTASHDNKSPRQKQRIFYDSSPELFPRRISHERTNLKFTFSFDDTASESLSHDLAGTLLPKEPATPLHDAVVVEFEPLMAGPLLPYSRAPFDFSSLPPSRPAWTLAGPLCDGYVSQTADELVLLKYLHAEQSARGRKCGWWLSLKSMLVDVTDEEYYRLYPAAAVFHDDIAFSGLVKSSL